MNEVQTHSLCELYNALNYNTSHENKAAAIVVRDKLNEAISTNNLAVLCLCVHYWNLFRQPDTNGRVIRFLGLVCSVQCVRTPLYEYFEVSKFIEAQIREIEFSDKKC